MKFYEILASQRKKLNMSLDELISISGVPRGTTTKILTGVTPNPGIETLKAITYALGLTLEDLDDEGIVDRRNRVMLSQEESHFLSAYRAADPSARKYALQILENNPAVDTQKENLA